MEELISILPAGIFPSQGHPNLHSKRSRLSGGDSGGGTESPLPLSTSRGLRELFSSLRAAGCGGGWHAAVCRML